MLASHAACVTVYAPAGVRACFRACVRLHVHRGGASRQIRGVPTKPFWVRVKARVRVGLWFGSDVAFCGALFFSYFFLFF